MKKILFYLTVFICSIFLSCENEPIDVPDINTDTIDEELFSYLTLITDDPTEEEINCIEFNYSFTLYIFDEEMELINVETVYDNTSFINILGGLSDTESISLNYPITGTLNNGEQLTINTNDELQEGIRACSKEERQGRCNSTLKECFWTVRYLPEFPNEFEGDTYKINDDGTVQLYHNNNVFFGTWITLYIGDTLYLNIDLNDDTDTETFWDHNWEVAVLTDTQIDISNEQTMVSIKKECDITCDTDNFKVCETENNPGFGNFNLSNFILCIEIPSSHNVIGALSYSFFETEEDANNNENALNTESYTNIENPQSIIVRIAYKTTDELIEIKTITIEAVPCTEG